MTLQYWAGVLTVLFLTGIFLTGFQVGRAYEIKVFLDLLNTTPKASYQHGAVELH